MKYVKLFRVNQYIKNSLIFFPIFFALKFTEISLIFRSFMAFAAFSLVASSVYIFNDIKDVASDKLHPEKKNRPIAAGIIRKNTASVLMTVSLFSGLSIGLLMHKNLFLLLLIYAFMNLLYTIVLKQIPILDIFIISTGFLLRLMCGTDFAGISGVIPSNWIIIMTFLLALFLAIAKRRDDVVLSLRGNQTRKSVAGYNLEFINSAMSIMAAVIIVSYILYTVNPEVSRHFHSEHIYLTVIFVILGIFRYLQLTFVFNKSGNPTEIALRDRFIQLTIFGWLLMFIILAY